MRIANTYAALSARVNRKLSTSLCSYIITNIFRPKLKKYPEGYPGDSEQLYPLGRRELRPARTHVRWTCEKCDTVFKDHGKTCESCGHEKCDDCPRKPPKKVKKPLDPEAVKSVEERMKNLEVSPAA